jgi:hypothetical protein
MDRAQMIDLGESLRILSLDSVPSVDRLKHTYRSLIKLYHPDHHPGRPDWSNRMVTRLNQAYRVLLEHLAAGPPGSPTARSPLGSPPTPGSPAAAPLRVEPVIRGGDQALRDCVVGGCLHRISKNILAQPFLEEVRRARDALGGLLYTQGRPEPALFFYRLFCRFVESTENRAPHSLPSAWNSTRFFRQLTLANRYLDRALRSFYHYLHHRRPVQFINIPLSLLGDSETFYRFVLKGMRSGAGSRQVESRLELIELYRRRIWDPRLWRI